MFSINGASITQYTYGSPQALIFEPHKIDLKLIIDLIIKAKIIKLLEETIRTCSHDLLARQ